METVSKEFNKENASFQLDNQPEWLKNLVRPSTQDEFAKRVVGNFPYHDLALLHQLAHQLKNTLYSKRFSAAMSSLLVAIGGRMYDRITLNEACATCCCRKASKQCSQCHDVSYCDVNCQRVHWGIHKKVCSKQPKIPAGCPFSKAAAQMNLEKPKQGTCPVSGKNAEDLASTSTSDAEITTPKTDQN